MSRFLLLALVLFLGCKSTPPPPARPVIAPLPLPPVQVSWQEIHRSATQTELVARVVRRVAIHFALEVSVTLPAGATLTSGRARFTLAPNTEPSMAEEAVTVTYAKLPEGDLRLAADGEAADMGVHARNAYRFGRPEPLVEVAAPTGPELKFGERNFGPSIPITADPPRQSP